MFITRLISGVLLLVLSFFFINFGGYPLAIILLVLSLTAFFEMGRALKIFDKKVNPLIVWGFISIVTYYCIMAINMEYIYLVMTVILSIIGFLVIYVFTFPRYQAEDISEAVFSLLYAPIMLSFVYLTRNLEGGKYIVWMIYISSWGADTLAYCVGMLTGKTIGNHKMSPKLSPKKSIEGALGGILGAALLAWLYGHFVMAGRVSGIPYLEWMLAIIGAAGAFMSMIGDLAASAVKRNKDIKDYGKCIPGHGGILDRFDSMIFTAPLTFFLSIILLSVI